nr:hypothetical protein [Tanacetum cinerariifolium]
MSSPSHPTTDIEDAFSSNFSDYTMASPNYFSASPGNISPNPPDNLSKYLLASLAISPFHDMQAYNGVANKPPILLQDPITPPTILTPFPVLPPSLLFDPQYFFVPEELLAPKKQIHPPSSSSTTLSNSSRKQAFVVINAIVGVVIVVASIGVVVVVIIIGIAMVDGGVSHIIKLSFVIIGISLGPVFLLGLSAFAMAAAYASRAATTLSVISFQMVASVIDGVADVDVLLGAIYQHIHANTEYRLRHWNNGMSDPIGGLDTKTHQKNKDPSDEDGGTGMGDLTRVSLSLGEISLEGNKSWESNIGDSNNTRDGG